LRPLARIPEHPAKPPPAFAYGCGSGGSGLITGARLRSITAEPCIAIDIRLGNPHGKQLVISKSNITFKIENHRVPGLRMINVLACFLSKPADSVSANRLTLLPPVDKTGGPDCKS